MPRRAAWVALPAACLLAGAGVAACSDPPEGGGDGSGSVDAAPGPPDAAPVPDAPPPDAAPPMPNLVLLPERIVPTIYVDHMTFGPSSCSVAEGMATYGRRRMLRFDTATHNDSVTDLFVGAPPEDGVSDDTFVWSSCHGHHHFTGYAVYELVDALGNVVVKTDGTTETAGRKMAFCLEDTDRITPSSKPKNSPDCKPGDAPNSPCLYTCNYQGISAGWADTYWTTLPGQWIDICDVPPGDYFLRIRINPEHRLPESNYDDNEFLHPISIGPAPTDEEDLCVPVEPPPPGP